jgi:hypothetical protein
MAKSEEKRKNTYQVRINKNSSSSNIILRQEKDGIISAKKFLKENGFDSLRQVFIEVERKAS